MALAYPVGECFFQRSGLDTSQPEGFHASDPNQFHTRMLVEYVWNKEAHHGSKECNSPGGYWHFRSGYKIVRGAWWNTDYGNWTHLPFSYGPTEKDIKRTNNHNLCVNGNRFRDREKGGSYEVCSAICKWLLVANTKEPWFMVCIQQSLCLLSGTGLTCAF